MKIAILTQSLSTNYGGILQNYALQTVLRRMGHEPVTLHIVQNRSIIRWVLSLCKSIINFIIGRGWTARRFPTIEQHRTSGMTRFIKRHITCTHPAISYKAAMVEECKAQLLLVGSDQTWRPRYNKRIEDSYFNFARKLNLPAVAYAVSFGTTEWEYDKKQTQKCSELIKKFRAVSVRERSGIELCHRHLDYDKAEWVLDPTLLLTRKDYEAICNDIPQQAPYLFAYILDITEEKRAFCIQLAQQKGIPLHLMQADKSVNATDCPEKWLASFRDASFVVTDSFHGTVFSLIFHCDFLTFYNTNRGNARFDSLSKQFDIANRIITDYDIISEKEHEIKWDTINVQLAEWKEKSFKFLEEQLY